MLISGVFNYIAEPNVTRIINKENVYLECDTSGGPVVINLCKISELNGFHNVKLFVSDASDNASVNNITINANAPDKIDGGASAVISANGGSCEVRVADADSWMALESNQAPDTSDWKLNGNTNGSVKSIGTQDNFDFPVIVNGVEVARWSPGSAPYLPNDGRFYINQLAPDNGSNAGGQLSALRPNRAQWRMNQYGANNAGGGLTTFKSRSTTVGAPLNPVDAVQVGDIIQGFTAIAVTNNALIPLAYTQRLVVVSNTNGNVAVDWELSLASTRGTTNSIRKAFAISADGIPRLREATAPQEAIYPSVAGLITLDGLGTATVNNLNVNANTRFNLTYQDNGTAPAVPVYISARVNGTSFTIVGTPNCQVYWQMFEPQPVA